METVSEMTNLPGADVTKEKLVTDLKTVAHDAEELIKATAGDLGEKTKEARARLAAALENAKATGRHLQEKAVAGAKATDKVIRDHPYQALGIAFGAGIIIGLLLNTRR